MGIGETEASKAVAWNPESVEHKGEAVVRESFL